MEASEAPTPDPTELPDTEGDPFADVEPDPLAGTEEGEPLPPGVEEGSLGGVNPSEEAARIKAEEEAAAEGLQDPEAELGMEEPEPEEGEPLPPAEAVPADEEPVEVPAEPGEPAAEEPAPEPEPEPEPETPPEEAPEAETPVEGKEAEAEEPKKPKGRSRKKGGGKKRAPANGAKGDREYVILKQVGPMQWEEAFERTKKDTPAILKARNGTVALRRAYHKLTEGQEEPADFTLVASPEAYFRPKPVNGRVHKQTAITIG